MLLLILWQITVGIQGVLALGTAYRLTKTGGDSGPALCWWLIVLGLAAFIPGLGFYLWYRFREDHRYNHDRYLYEYQQYHPDFYKQYHPSYQPYSFNNIW